MIAHHAATGFHHALPSTGLLPALKLIFPGEDDGEVDTDAVTKLITSKIGEVLASIKKEGPVDAAGSPGKDDLPGAKTDYKGSSPALCRSAILLCFHKMDGEM